jgi:hypothetical protein
VRGAVVDRLPLPAAAKEKEPAGRLGQLRSQAQSGRGYIDQREAFLARRVGETLIKRDDTKRCGTMFRGCEGRRKLQCVAAGWMRAPSLSHRARLCRAFGNQQRNDRRSVPKYHRPSRRSSMRTSTADAPALARGSWLLNRARGRPGPAEPHKPLTEEPRQPSILPAYEITRHGLEPRNGTPPVHDEHGRAALETIDQGAQVVLGLGYSCLLHWTNLAGSKKAIQAI